MVFTGIEFIYHYLDDFLCTGPPGKNTCRRSLDTMMRACEELGLPLASEKVEGPASCLIFLGIELDSNAMQIRLPDRKLGEAISQTVA